MEGVWLSNLWSLDPESKAWTEIEISGMRPPATSHDAGGDGWTGDGSTLYLFPVAWSVDDIDQHLWAFYTTTSTWAQLAAGPGARGESCFGASGGLIYLLGGWRASDFWSYNPADNVWTERTDSVTVEGSNPLTRLGGALLDVAGELLLVHGTGSGIASMLPRVPCATCD